MQAERDHLVKVVFPAVREKLEPYRVHLIDIDLRWGVTREQAENDQALGLCLEQIDECRPFFLGLLGQRCGWVPRRVPPRLLRSHAWLRDHAGRSITELEFRHGALSRSPAQARVLFCLRDPAATTGVPEPHRTAFVETDPDALRQLEELTGQVRASGHELLDNYPCAWQPDRQRLGGLEVFGDAVADWLWQAVRAELRLPERPVEVTDWLTDEADQHERYLESRLRVFVGRHALRTELMAFVRGGDAVPCLVTGEPGCGKTAVLAHFADACRREMPDAFVLPHFTGAGARSTSLRDLLRRLGSELRRRFGLEDEPAEQPDRLAEQFREVLWQVPPATRVVLVLDGLDRLDDADQAHELYWLPGRLPPHVKIVASCAAAARVRQAFDRLGARAVALGPLTDRERLVLLHRLPSLSAKTLDARQIRSFLDNPATRNPLFLTAALEELRGFGSFEDLDHRIVSLPSGDAPVEELFAQVLGRLEADFGAGLVSRVLRLLAVARRGLSTAELHGLTSGAADLFPLLRQLRPWLVQRGVLIDLGPADLREAVRRRYLPRDADRQTAHRILADYFTAVALDARKVDELPWHLTQAEEWHRLRDLLADLEFFDAAWQASAFEVKACWARLEGVARLRLVEAYSDPVARPVDHPSERLARLAMLLADTGHTTEAVPIRRHLLEQARGDGDPVRLAAAMSNLALLHKARGEIDDALALYADAETICRRHDDRHGLQRTLGNRARLLRGLGDLDGAMTLLREQEAICRAVGNRQGLQASLGTQAQVLQARGDAAGALRLLSERERICREMGNRHGLQIALNGLALLLQQAGDLDAALQRLEESEAVCRDLGNRQGLQMALGQRATILRSRNDLAGAAALLAEQECLCRAIGNDLGLQIALGNRAQLCRDVGQWEAALDLLTEAERLARQLRNPEAIAVTLRHRATVLADAGRTSEARTALDEAARVADAHGLTSLAAWVQALRARLDAV